MSFVGTLSVNLQHSHSYYWTQEVWVGEQKIWELLLETACCGVFRRNFKASGINAGMKGRISHTNDGLHKTIPKLLLACMYVDVLRMVCLSC